MFNVYARELTDVVVQARYILLISELLNASSHAVKYEAATTLTALTQNPAAVKGECLLNLSNLLP